MTAGLDVARFLDDVNRLLSKAGALGQQSNLPSSLTDQQRQDIQRSVKSAKLDVWTGKDDKTLRRLRIDIDISVPGEVQKRAGGLKDGKLVFELTIADLNRPQTIKTPTNARPLADLTAALTQGSGSGTQPTPAPSGTPTAPAAPGVSQQYLDCLQKAGSDISKVQKCAELLGG